MALIDSEPYREVKPLMITTYERGMVDASRKNALMLLDARFGERAQGAEKRVSELTLALEQARADGV